ncbi:thiamine-phosphate kinase [Portibacter lacus]|uniref:Thiamine-monophosphate kinase n=1 Tax=Portibacter lacus TaxID=1099794 RepID=A0AA37SRG9_9BACT|nr:thiamine-phosphate kinase [Portibacter lacus]GLR18204.1 thiamine-monophosphate kinase [Portibacter lacus]
METRTDVNEFGEFGLIEHLTKYFVDQNPTTVKGVGDDAAVIDNNNLTTVVSTDMLVEGIHFDLMYSPLKHLGYKAVVVNLSDIYAMNAVPGQITVSLAISNRFSVEALDELYSGILAACEYYKVDLVGGDMTSSPKGMVISVTAIGSAPKENLVYRNGAKAGDLICISGDLGAAYIGLQILEREKQLFLDDPNLKTDLEDQQYIIGRQLKPEARWDIIKAFRDSGLIPTSMIDVSDGLASEIFHLCKQSKTGAIVEESKIPLHPDTETMALKFQLDPVTCALNGGEDYELLFTIDPNDLGKVRTMDDIFIIGEMVEAEGGIKLKTTSGNLHTMKAQGWKHF